MNSQAVWVVASIALIGCGAQSSRAPSDERAPGAPDSSVAVVGAADTVLLSVGGDSVRIEASGPERVLLWTSRDGSDPREQWRSGDFGYATPWVALVDVNRDSRLDLLFSLQYEELIGGAVLLSEPRGAASFAYREFDGLCRAPEFADLDGDGRPEIIESRPGAVSLESCRFDGPAERCAKKVGTDWRSVLTYDDPARVFRVDTTAFKEFYRAEATRLSEGAAAARSVPETCSASIAARLDSMSARASRIGLALTGR